MLDKEALEISSEEACFDLFRPKSVSHDVLELLKRDSESVSQPQG